MSKNVAALFLLAVVAVSGAVFGEHSLGSSCGTQKNLNSALYAAMREKVTLYQRFSPAHEILRLEKDLLDCVETLLGKGLSVNFADQDGITPAMLAASYGFDDVLELLVSHGADLQVKDSYGNSASTYKALREQQESPAAKKDQK